MLFNNLLKKYVKVFVCSITLIMMFIGTLYAAPKEEKIIERKKIGAEQPVAKSVSGTISYVDKRYVSIITKQDKKLGLDEEIGFWIDENEQEGWRKKLSEMKPGDRIQVQYDQILQDYDERDASGKVERSTKIEKLKAKSIKFLSPAKTSLSSE